MFLIVHGSCSLFNPITQKWDIHLNNCIEHRAHVFVNGPGDLGSIPGRVIPKTQNMVLDASLLKHL